MSCACANVEYDTERLDTLLRHVSIIVPEVPYEVALDMLRQAYIEFGRKTKLLASRLAIRSQRDVRNYALVAPEGYEVFGLLNPTDLNQGYTLFPNVDHWYFAGGDRFRMDGNSQILFERSPSRDNDEYLFALHLIPNECAVTIPREVSVPYGKGIAMGAVADMLDMPNRPWYNPRAAQAKRVEFNRTIQAARTLHETNRGTRPMMMQPLRVL